MISLSGITKTYQMGSESLQVLRGIDLEIRKHEFAAIIGPSGSGKSTLMNMIGCLDVPTSGTYILDQVQVNGMDDNDLSDIRNRKIGFILGVSFIA